MRFVGIQDLFDRWGMGWGNYTRKGIYLVRKQPDFPEPHHVVNQGKTPVWDLSDIQAYEEEHKELRNEALKKKKVASFWRAKRKG
jgi:hypothetical protein